MWLRWWRFCRRSRWCRRLGLCATPQLPPIAKPGEKIRGRFGGRGRCRRGGSLGTRRCHRWGHRSGRRHGGRCKGLRCVDPWRLPHWERRRRRRPGAATTVRRRTPLLESDIALMSNRIQVITSDPLPTQVAIPMWPPLFMNTKLKPRLVPVEVCWDAEGRQEILRRGLRRRRWLGPGGWGWWVGRRRGRRWWLFRRPGVGRRRWSRGHSPWTTCVVDVGWLGVLCAIVL